MDDLDKQLAELQLLADKEKFQHGTLGKKIGPAVPPKPKKPTQPLVPQSYSIKQQMEPSYAGRLNNTPQYYANVGGSSTEQQQQYANLTAPHTSVVIGNNSHYANVGSTAVSRQQQSEVNNSGVLGKKGYAGAGVNHQHMQQQQLHNHVTYSNVCADGGVIYSNVTHDTGAGAAASRGPSGIYARVGQRYPDNDDLPPPPPPPLLDGSSGRNLGHGVIVPGGGYGACAADVGEFPPPPPSPVSSSYSELRRHTQPSPSPRQPQLHHHAAVGDVTIGHAQQQQQEEQEEEEYANYRRNNNSQLQTAAAGYEYYSNYGGMSQSSSTYESIYEPINPPRPPSQLSSRSNYSLYTPSYGGSVSGAQPHAQVDRLTEMLVEGMAAGGEEARQGQEQEQGEVYGVCVKCGDKVVGENSGCTAMEQIYHTTCFTCHHCAIHLQGKPFYSLDGNPYCKEDYLNTLEKCCVCMNPILERILRATGKPYHPKCFTCVICGKSLDGIPFTVDATNQIHCIDDFHKKFAPRCCVCNQPIMPEPGKEETVRVVALDRSFHIQCYKCEDCGLVLSSEAEGRGCYPLDNHVLCKSCNAKRVQALTSHMTTDL